MSTALQKAKNEELDLWYDETKLAEIRKIICPGAPLTDIEFEMLVKLGRSTGLNPITKEIWAIKFKAKDGTLYPATIFIGRDGYRKSAQRDPEYDYHQADAVYSNDKFQIIDGLPSHQYTLTNRGELVGAYCIAKRKRSTRPVYVFVELKEYDLKQGLWVDSTKAPAKKATMIKKVAESQCIRACFQDLLGGTYSPEELPDHEITVIDNETGKELSKKEALESKLRAAKGVTIEAEIIEDGELLSQSQLDEIEALLSIKEFAKERLIAALGYHKVESIDQLTAAKADLFIRQLNKIADKE